MFKKKDIVKAKVNKTERRGDHEYLWRYGHKHIKLRRNEFNYTLGSVTATINGEKKQRFVYRFDGLKETMHKEYICLPRWIKPKNIPGAQHVDLAEIGDGAFELDKSWKIKGIIIDEEPSVP